MDYLDFSELKGRYPQIRALTIAAAGGHNVLLLGPYGCGKTLLARRLPGILPDPSERELEEIRKIYAAGGKDVPEGRPFRAPHHTVSDCGMLGGGMDPQPGEVSLAHNGILYLDEFPEFKKVILDCLVEPMRDGHIVLQRKLATRDFQSRFMLVAAMAPCPCGASWNQQKECRCSQTQKLRWYQRAFCPVMDLIDVRINVHMDEDPVDDGCRETSESIRKRVSRARGWQKLRFQGKTSIRMNRDIPDDRIDYYCTIGPDLEHYIKHAIEGATNEKACRARVLRVARTIADLWDQDYILEDHVGEALKICGPYRRYW